MEFRVVYPLYSMSKFTCVMTRAMSIHTYRLVVRSVRLTVKVTLVILCTSICIQYPWKVVCILNSLIRGLLIIKYNEDIIHKCFHSELDACTSNVVRREVTRDDLSSGWLLITRLSAYLDCPNPCFNYLIPLAYTSKHKTTFIPFLFCNNHWILE